MAVKVSEHLAGREARDRLLAARSREPEDAGSSRDATDVFGHPVTDSAGRSMGSLHQRPMMQRGIAIFHEGHISEEW